MTLDIINDTGMEMAYIAGRIPFPGHSLTLIIKGVFDLVPDGVVQLAKEQAYPTGDVFYDDDGDELSGPRYPSDFGYLKPKADVMLVGYCHAPEGREITEQESTFGVGDFNKTLKIIGDKFWESTILDQEANVCAPYTAIELRYDNAFGGTGYPDNPVGKGKQAQESATGEVRRLFPNILNNYDDPNAFLSTLHPAGFGPIAPSWPLRHGCLGSYKGTYLKTRWPWYAENFDFHYFNAAPADQQITGYLQGDEELLFENIHPTIRKYKSTLPGLRCRSFVASEVDGGEDIFKEVQLNLDTLWVDMDASQITMVWRGWTEISDEDFPEITGIFIITEPLSEPAQSFETCKALFLKRLTEIAEEDDPPEEEPEDSGPEPAEVDNELEKAEAQMEAHLKKAGIDPNNPPPRSKEAIATERALLAEMGMADKEEEPAPPTPETFMAAFAGGQQFNEVMVENLDLAGQNLAGINFENSILKDLNLNGANLSEANLAGATFINVSLISADLSGATVDQADLTDIDLSEAILTGASIKATIFEKSILTKVNFQQAEGALCNLTGADLTDSQFQHGNFAGADFSHATLIHSDFSHAVLADASFEEVKAQNSVMDHADLTTLRASDNSDFSHCSFKQATGHESIWEGANLEDADFSFCHLHGADFSHANLKGANLHAANMPGSRFNNADLTKATATYINLFAGSLKKANLTETDFSDANLYGVEFLEATHATAIFTKANLKRSKLA